MNYARVNDRGDIGVYVTKQQAENYSKEKQKTSVDTSVTTYAHKGRVVDVIFTDQYTYVQVKEDGRLYWLAGPIARLGKGDQIGFSEGVLMSGFYSKSLKRKFDEILFVGQLALIE